MERKKKTREGKKKRERVKKIQTVGGKRMGT